MGADCFLYEMTPIYMGGSNEDDRVASSESVPIHFNSNTVKILKFGTPQTIAIIVLKIEKFDVTLH